MWLFLFDVLVLMVFGIFVGWMFFVILVSFGMGLVLMFFFVDVSVSNGVDMCGGMGGVVRLSFCVIWVV